MSLNIYSMATDREAEVKGVTHDWNGAKVVVARANNQKFAQYVATEVELHRPIIDGKDKKKSQEMLDRINRDAFCKYILVGWSGFVDAENNEVKYNLTNCRKIYDLVPDLVRDVRILSAQAEHYRLETLKSDAEELKK